MSRRARHYLAPLIITPLLLCAAGSARAQADFTNLLEAQELFKQAEFQFRADQYKPALMLYEAAYKKKPLPTFLFNIGQCHHLLGQCRLSSVILMRFLTSQPDAVKEAEVRRMIASCKPAAGQAKTDPVAATPGDKISGAEPGTEPGAEPVDRLADGIGRQRRLLLWAGIGTSAALLIAGAITGGIAQDKSNQYNDESTSQEDRVDLRESGLKLRNAAIATLSIGAGAALGTALIYLLNPLPEEAPTVSLGPVNGGGAFTLGGTF